MCVHEIKTLNFLIREGKELFFLQGVKQNTLKWQGVKHRLTQILIIEK
jgi:hypothetical protein